MEENSGNNHRDGGDAVRNNRSERSNTDYRNGRYDRNNGGSSSRGRFQNRSKGNYNAYNFQGEYNGYDMSGGYGFEPSYGGAMPFNSDPNFKNQWNPNAFQPMPFLNTDAYMMDPSAFQVPLRKWGPTKKHTDRSKRAHSTRSNDSDSKDKSRRGGKGKDAQKDEFDREDGLERHSKRMKSHSHFSDEDAEDSKEEKEVKRNGSNTSVGRREDDDRALHRRRVPSVDRRRREDDERRGVDRHTNERREKSEMSAERQRWRRDDEDESRPYRRREAQEDDEDRNVSRSRQRRGRSKSVEHRPSNSDTPMRKAESKANGSWSDEEDTGSKQSKPSYEARRKSPEYQDSRDSGGATERVEQRERQLRRRRREDEEREREETQDRNERRGRYDRQERDRRRPYSNTLAERELEELDNASGTSEQPIVPVTPPRDGTPQPFFKTIETFSRAAHKSETDNTSRSESRAIDRLVNDYRRDEVYRSRRQERDKGRKTYEEPFRRRSPSLMESKSAVSRKEDDEAPSDAMQAAMEAALGMPLRSIGSSSKDAIEPASVEIVQKEETFDQAPSIIRARPDEVYEQVAQVGEGTYGQVFKAKADKTGVIVALKKIRMESEKDGFPITALREIKILQGLRHENVVRLHEMLLSKNSIYMVFEYLEHDLNGILSQSAIRFTPAHLKSLAQQLLAGLAYLHHHSILHRDLKGSNLLLHRDGTLKLADFGLARRYTKRVKNNLDYTNRVVTLWYRPPELLFGETCYNDAIDVWGAGCIFLELFTRKPLFQGNDEIHQVQVLFELLGPIQKQDWPEADTLPWYDLVRPIQDDQHDTITTTAIRDCRLYSTLAPLMPSDALEVAAALLLYNPSRRVSAANALKMDYFASNLPKPEKPKSILESVTGEWHEFESRQARRGAPAPVESHLAMGSAESKSRLAVKNGQMGPPDSVASHGRGREERQTST
jgi:CTD kinase subunit alpha